MKLYLFALTLIFSGLLLTVTASAQKAPVVLASANAPAIASGPPHGVAPKAEPNEVKPTFLPKWIQFSTTVRGRFEDPAGMNFVPAASDAYYLSRIRLDLTLRPTPWLRVYAEGQDARVFGYNAPTQPASMHNALDIRQGYIDLSTEGKQGLGLRVGRQELRFGSGRLFGVSDWGLSRTYDAARASLSRRNVKLDLFAASLVQIDASRCDRHKPGEQAFGNYATFEIAGSDLVVEQYFYVKRQLQVAAESGQAGNAATGTLGFRVLGKLPGRFDYSAELARQLGTYAGDPISAIAGIYVAGWTVNNSPKKPRFVFEYDHASGDPSSKDGRRQTFDQLYGTNQLSFAAPNLIGLRNMRNARAGFETLIAKKLKVQSDFNEFYLATAQDGYYNAGGARSVLNRTATSRHIGSEISMMTVTQVTKTLSIGAGIAHLFPGGYLKQSTSGGGYTYPYLSWTKRM